jgi:hypothetical protein
VAGEGVVAAGIAADVDVRLARQRRPDRDLGGLGNELVLLGQVHQHRRRNGGRLVQVFLRIAAVVGDHRVHLAAGGGQEAHRAAQAEAHHRDLRWGVTRRAALNVDGLDL